MENRKVEIAVYKKIGTLSVDEDRINFGTYKNITKSLRLKQSNFLHDAIKKAQRKFHVENISDIFLKYD